MFKKIDIDSRCYNIYIYAQFVDILVLNWVVFEVNRHLSGIKVNLGLKFCDLL
jgi:hypothetical protein